MRKKRILKFLLYAFLSMVLLLIIAFAIVYQEFGPVDHSKLAAEKVRDGGLVADLFYPKGSKLLPVIIAVGGSGGGFLPGKEMQFLALEDYAVLSLAYFNAEGLPGKLEEIPLEYFGSAMDWVSNHPVADSTKIIVLGVSRGAELALLLGSKYPRIKGIVAYAPGYFILPNAADTEGSTASRSSWTWQGKPLPFAPLRVLQDHQGELVRYRGYVEPLLQRADQEDYLIKAETGKAAILLLSGQDDQTWPAAEMSTRMEARLKSKQYPNLVRNVIFPDAGHWLLLFKESYPVIASSFFREFSLKIRNKPYRFATGGTVWGNVRARRAARAETLTFLARFRQTTH